MLQGEREMAVGQQDDRQVPADRHPAGAARRAPGRGHVRHRRERNPARVGQGQGHRQGAEDPDRGLVRACPTPRSTRWSRTPRSTRPRTRIAGSRSRLDNRLDSLVYQTEKNLDEAIDDATKKDIEEKLETGRQALKQDDSDQIQAATEAIQEAVQGAAQQMYAAAGAAQEAQAEAGGFEEPVDEAEPADEEDVVEADYEIVEEN